MITATFCSFLLMPLPQEYVVLGKPRSFSGGKLTTFTRRLRILTSKSLLMSVNIVQS